MVFKHLQRSRHSLHSDEPYQVQRSTVCSFTDSDIGLILLHPLFMQTNTKHGMCPYISERWAQTIQMEYVLAIADVREGGLG